MLSLTQNVNPMLFRRLQEFFFPRQCVVCGQRLALGELYVCPACLLKLPFEEEMDWRMNRHILRWRGEHPALAKCGALCIYRRENAVARLVHEMEKYSFSSGCSCISHCTMVLFPLPLGALTINILPFIICQFVKLVSFVV